jgi:hypothetical protein
MQGCHGTIILVDGECWIFYDILILMEHITATIRLKYLSLSVGLCSRAGHADESRVLMLSSSMAIKLTPKIRVAYIEGLLSTAPKIWMLEFIIVYRLAYGFFFKA